MCGAGKSVTKHQFFESQKHTIDNKSLVYGCVRDIVRKVISLNLALAQNAHNRTEKGSLQFVTCFEFIGIFNRSIHQHTYTHTQDRCSLPQTYREQLPTFNPYTIHCHQYTGTLVHNVYLYRLTHLNPTNTNECVRPNHTCTHTHI